MGKVYWFSFVLLLVSLIIGRHAEMRIKYLEKEVESYHQLKTDSAKAIRLMSRLVWYTHGRCLVYSKPNGEGEMVVLDQVYGENCLYLKKPFDFGHEKVVFWPIDGKSPHTIFNLLNYEYR